jgi:hypothetical protein
MGTIDERTLEKTRSRALKNALKGDSLSDLCSDIAPISRWSTTEHSEVSYTNSRNSRGVEGESEIRVLLHTVLII